jgi:Flp pilus assembly pilin Flp
MPQFLNHFYKQEDGAVTVDWVVLTAAIVGLGVLVITTVGKGALDSSTGLGVNLSNLEVQSD